MAFLSQGGTPQLTEPQATGFLVEHVARGPQQPRKEACLCLPIAEVRLVVEPVMALAPPAPTGAV